ncbi:MAG TPA: hypothetical protein DEH15_05855 [Marinilabiliales bacterium]|nr:hypothetical protein [Marinilabiliales bacterium]
MDQNQLNIRLKESEPSAYEELYKQTFSRLLGYCRLFVQNQAQANDMVQECFVKLWEKRNTIKPNHSVESLLFVMLRNKCLNYLRDQKIRGIDKNINLIEESELQHLYHLDFLGKEEIKLEESLIEAIRLSVEKLPEKRKLVFVKTKIEGRKNKEVAEELGISVKAVEKHLHQAREQIQQEMILKFPLLSVLIAFMLK